MNYGLSAYTKVLELEKRIGANSGEANALRVYDSGKSDDYTFSSEFILNSDKLFVNAFSPIYYKLNFDIELSEQARINISYYVNDVKIYEKNDNIEANQNKPFYLDFTYNPTISEIVNGYLKIVILDSKQDAVLTNYRLIVLGASGTKNNISSDSVELRACKTPDDTYIVSYSNDGIVYACEINNDSTSLDFVSIFNATSHCFAFDKSNNLHLYYVDSNYRLYDKTLNSELNDILISENVSMVYAVKTSDYNSSDIAICFVSMDKKNVYYTSLSNGEIGEVNKLILPNANYVDITMIAGEKFVYLVCTNDAGSSYLLKSAYEPLLGSAIENISSSVAMLVQKYYTLGEHAGDLIDVITASISMTASIARNYELILENITNDKLYASLSLAVEPYEMPTEQTVHYTVVIDKAIRTHNTRCVYADDAEGFLPVTNTNDELVMNGWQDRFPFNKIKPCALRGGEFLGYIDPNDYTKFEDGTPVNSDASDSFIDVMVEIPKVYYAIENIDPYVYVHISNQPIDERFKCYAHVYDGIELDKIYVSAYHCGYKEYNGKNTFFSFTNNLPNCYDIINSTTYSELLENKEVGYRMMNFDQTVLLQCLFIVMFKSTGSQHAFARGNNNNSGSIMANGYCDKLGMYSGSIKTPNPCKIFGIENIYGNCYTRIEGINMYTAYTHDTYLLKKRSAYSTVPLNRDGDGYEEFTNPELDGVYNSNFYLNDPYATTELGFLAKSEKYSGATDLPNYIRYYCDSTFLTTSYGAWWGGDTRSYTFGGIFHYRSDYGGVLTGYDYGYRLVYYPLGGN